MDAIRFVTLFALVLVIAAGPAWAADPGAGGAKQNSLEPSTKSCPHTTYINCMPPVPKERRPMCTREYLEWMKEHCPGVRVVR